MEEEKQEKEEEKNVVTIAGRENEVYIQTILDKFQRFDQIEICALDTYLDKTIFIIRQWEAMGVYPIGRQIKFTKTEEDIKSRDGKKFRKYVNRITITKDPNIYRFTKN